MKQKQTNIYALYDDDGEFVNDYTLKELSEFAGISEAACYQRIRTGGRIVGYRGEKVDVTIGKKNMIWAEFETTRKYILNLLKRRTKE